MQIHHPFQLNIEQKEVQTQGEERLQDEESNHCLHKPGFLHQLPVNPSAAILGSRVDIRLWDGHRLRGVKQLSEGFCHRIGGRAFFEQVQRPSSLPVIEVLQDHLFGDLQNIDQLLLLAEPGLIDKVLYDQVEQNEYYVNQGNGGLVEVVVVACDELAQLVYESSKSKAPQDGHQIIGRFVDVSESNDQGDHHEHTAQKDMGDVQIAGAEGSDSRSRPKRSGCLKRKRRL